MAANANPSGSEPQASAGKNERARIRLSPAKQATTSGNTGSQRDNATIHTPERANNASYFLISAAPASVAAQRGLIHRVRPYAMLPERNEPAALIAPPIHTP